MKEIEQVLLQLRVLDNLRDDKSSRQVLSVCPQRIGLPETALTPNEKQVTKDVEALSVHVRSNE